MKIYNYKLQIAVLIFLCILDMGGLAYLVQWREEFWSAVSDKHYADFIHLMWIFSTVALGLCIVSGYETYIQNKLALNWRRVLTNKALKIIHERSIEGMSQRIQEDCKDYPLLIIDLIKTFGMQFIMIIYYIWVIVAHIGILYAVLPMIYAGLSTGIGYYIAHPLIQLNYINQVLEAAFRQALTKLNYAKVHRNNSKMFKKTKHLQYFQSFYDQILYVFPYILLAPLYFGGKITFGVLMQLASAITRLTEALGTVVNNFDKINRFISCRRRLKEINVL